MSKIEWTDETWNPVIGCSKISAGCKNCYAERMAARQCHMRPGCEYDGVIDSGKWNGKTAFVESALNKPLHRRKPRKIFVCSMGDLFHESVPFEWIDKVFATMALCPQHTFQVLTKRPERMEEYTRGERDYVLDCMCAAAVTVERWPLPNVWLGTSVEDQDAAAQRLPHLLRCPAAVRFVSVEPMLGPLDLARFFGPQNVVECGHDAEQYGLYWVIVGGESGPGARPMSPNWVRSLRDQCRRASVHFLFKQWGEWLPMGQGEMVSASCSGHPNWVTHAEFGEGRRIKCEKVSLDTHNTTTYRVGKKAAGRLLDGVEHNEYPKED